MADMAKIRQRESDPGVAEHAQRVMDTINTRVDHKRVQLFGQMAKHMPHAAGKVQQLRLMAGELATAARDLVPCSRGCSACCHMPTLVGQEEAAVIAAETGAELVEPTTWFNGVIEAIPPYHAVPCTFLQDHKCSIYAHRPLACRLHVHIDRDNTLCTVIPGEQIVVPRLDTLRFDIHYVTAFGGPFAVKMADIREFFPRGAKK